MTVFVIGSIEMNYFIVYLDFLPFESNVNELYQFNH